MADGWAWPTRMQVWTGIFQTRSNRMGGTAWTAAVYIFKSSSDFRVSFRVPLRPGLQQAFRIVKSFRMHAVTTTLNGLPFAMSVYANARIRGLHRRTEFGQAHFELGRGPEAAL